MWFQNAFLSGKSKEETRPEYLCLLKSNLKKILECEFWYYYYQHPFSSVPFLFLYLKIYHLTTEKYTQNPGKLDKVSKAFLFTILLVKLRPEMQLKSISYLAGDTALVQVCCSPEAWLQLTKMPEKEAACSVFTSIFSTLILLCLQNIRIWPEFLRPIENSQVNFYTSKGQ